MQMKKYQQSWKIKPNNAQLSVNPDQADIQNIYSFCQHFRNYLTEFVYTCISIPKSIKLDDPLILVDDQQTLAMVIEIIKQQKFIFIDVINEQRNSYKGYISWLILGTHNQLYLIDAAKLHDKCYELKQALMRKNLIKFMHGSDEVLFALKRDFQIFMPNIFDLEVVQRYFNKKEKNSLQPKNAFKQFLNSLPSSIIGSRPLKKVLSSKIQQFYQNEIIIMSQIDRFFIAQDPEYQCYAYYNHYELLLKSYFHHVPSVQQFDELHKIQHSVSECNFIKYNQHHVNNLQKQNKKVDQFWVKDCEQQRIAEMLCQWREHIAKMRDINCQQVLGYQKVSTLAKTKINSILQISQICSSYPNQGRIYSLSLDDFERIFDIFQLYKQEKQQKTNQLVIPRRLPFYKSNDQKPIKQLFQQLKFLDPSNDWLNKKDDQAIKLYKEVISINEFDNSIAQQYMKELNLQKDNPMHLGIEDINRYVKYAEYLRNGNHKKLQQLYERSKNRKNSIQNDEEFEDNFISNQEYDNWEEIQNQLNLPNADSNGLVPSISSLQSISNVDVRSCVNFENFKSISVLKDKKLNSLNQLQSPGYFKKVEPLPQNIETIYLEAAKAKKNYVAKGQKKNNKTNKKESKTSLEKNPKKQEQFVPKKEEIFNLIYY